MMLLPRMLTLLAASGLMLGLIGCADPMLEARRLLPATHREWAADEAYTATMHRKLADIQSARGRFAEMSPQAQQQWARALETIVRHDDNEILRAAATRALADLPAQLATPGLLAAADDAAPSVRIAACDAWSQLASEQSVEVLAGILGSSTDVDVRLAAARALANFKDPRAIQALGQALESNDPALQFRATRSLARLTPVDYGQDIVAWRQYLSGENPPPPSSSWSLTARLPWIPWKFQ